MKRLLYLDQKSNEIENLLSGKKKFIIRAANIKKYPYMMIHQGYQLYFMNNQKSSKDLVLASALVKRAIFLELKTLEERQKLLNDYKDKLLLRNEKLDYVLERKYISIFELENIKEEYSIIDKSRYGMEEDWIRLKEVI